MLKSLKWILASICLAFLLAFTTLEEYKFPSDMWYLRLLAFDESIVNALIFGILLLWIIYIAAYRARYLITLSPQGLVVKYGVLWKDQSLIPFSKITQINISRDFTHFILGLHKLEIYIAGSGANAYEGKCEKLEGLNEKTIMNLYSSINQSLNPGKYKTQAEKNTKPHKIKKQNKVKNKHRLNDKNNFKMHIN